MTQITLWDLAKVPVKRFAMRLKWVSYYVGRAHGTTYPDMPWEPKESFRAVANYYGKQ